MECEICSVSYNTGSRIPKILSCGHTFCFTCLTAMFKENTILCANCRKETHFPQDYDSNRAVSALITNYSLLESASDDKEKQTILQRKKTIDQQKVYEMNLIPVQPKLPISMQQVVPLNEDIHILPENSGAFPATPENSDRAPARSPVIAPAPDPDPIPAPSNCCCQCPDMGKVSPLFILKLLAIGCLLMTKGLIIAYIIYLVDSDSFYYGVGICMVISLLLINIFFWTMLCIELNCAFSDGGARFCLLSFLLFFLHLGACLYGILEIFHDDERDFGDSLYALTVITEITTAISIILLAIIICVEKEQLNCWN